MKFEDYTQYILKDVWLKLPYQRNVVRALLVGVEFENERLNLKYKDKYNETHIQFFFPEDVITPEQKELLNIPDLFTDKLEANVKKQSEVS